MLNRTELQFAIITMWNGEPITHVATKIDLVPVDENNNIKVIVRGRFFNDPAPRSRPGTKVTDIKEQSFLTIIFKDRAFPCSHLNDIPNKNVFLIPNRKV